MDEEDDEAQAIELDDAESLDAEALRKPQIYRFINKLRRYVVACISVIRELVGLYRLANEVKVSINVKGVTMAKASRLTDEGEYPSFEKFIEDPRIKVDIKTLDPAKITSIRNSWVKAYPKEN